MSACPRGVCACRNFIAATCVVEKPREESLAACCAMPLNPLRKAESCPARPWLVSSAFASSAPAGTARTPLRRNCPTIAGSFPKCLQCSNIQLAIVAFEIVAPGELGYAMVSVDASFTSSFEIPESPSCRTTNVDVRVRR